ncbi:MAG: glycosyltransferase family 4 protein, partial [Cryomorphaceae bacterium]|nr:glycosyltransferase family 4 protein [Cryomorphaceae bacterium]
FDFSKFDIELHYCRFARKSIKFQFFLFKYILTNRIKVVHTWDLVSSLVVIPATKLLFVKHINGNIRGSIILKKHSLIYYITHLSFLFSNRVVANSNAGLSSKHLKVSKKNRVVHNGFDLNRKITPLIDDSIYKNDSFKIGMLSNLRDGKDFNLLIDAVKQLLLTYNASIKVYLVGDGPLREMLLERTKGYEDIFIFVGKSDNPLAHINEWDLCCMLSLLTDSHGEGISNSILEYFFLKKLTIVTNSGGNTEIVKNQVNGFVCKERDIEGLVEIIFTIYKNIGEYEDVKNMAYDSLKNDFSIEKMRDRYISIYNELN